jgi:hypothetical protein
MVKRTLRTEGVRIFFPANIAQIFTNENCYVDMLKILVTDDHTDWLLVSYKMIFFEE